MKKLLYLMSIVLFSVRVLGQDLTVQQYIDSFKGLAMEEMKRVGVPASITLAQGILESENGNSDLVKMSNNHFGIKCKSSWTGGSVFYDDDEQGECFRKYNTAEESYRDHSDYLKNTQRYAHLFTLDPTNYKSWCYGLKRAGYATNPRYPEVLIKYIENYDLQQYSLLALGLPKDRTSSEGLAESQNLNNESATEGYGSAVPNEKTKFNGLKAVFATRGTSLLALASRFKLSLAKLLEYNDLASDGLLSEDQFLYLEKKHKEGKKEVHIVREDETLRDIAQANAVQLASLKQYNDISDADMLKEGATIYLRPSIDKKVLAQEIAQPDTRMASAAPNNTIIHEVQPKEGLYSISRKYNVSVDEIREWNNLSSDALRIGQQLIISKK